MFFCSLWHIGYKIDEKINQFWNRMHEWKQFIFFESNFTVIFKKFDLPIQIPLYAMYLIFLQLSKYVFYCKLKAIWALKADSEAIDSQ